MLRKVEIGSSRYTEVLSIDEPGPGNAHHAYTIENSRNTQVPTGEAIDIYGSIKFQNGPIKEAGVNGCHNEDLLAIVIDRLQCFQSGPYKCRENAIAITKLEEAMHWLNHRTAARQARGIEGTHEI